MCTCVHMCTRVVMCTCTNVQWSLISIMQDLVKNNILILWCVSMTTIWSWPPTNVKGRRTTKLFFSQTRSPNAKCHWSGLSHISHCGLTLNFYWLHASHQDFKLNYILAFYCPSCTLVLHWVSLDLILTLRCLLDQIHCIVLLHRTRNIPSSK